MNNGYHIQVGYVSKHRIEREKVGVVWKIPHHIEMNRIRMQRTISPTMITRLSGVQRGH
jgi:hypothetical protein